MRRQCHVCGQRNGSCNRYILKNGQEVTICPSCLAFSSNEIAKTARQAHKDGLLVKGEVKR
jgi:ribosome-binding protein aMBF1 (putative translation factor)